MRFKNEYVIDIATAKSAGEPPRPICLVAKEINSGRFIRVWLESPGDQSNSPFESGDETVVVAYSGGNAIAAMLEGGWPAPANFIDLYAEFRVKTNGMLLPHGSGLMGAIIFYGASPVSTSPREFMRPLVPRDRSWTVAQKDQIMERCKGEVELIQELYKRMRTDLDRPRALLRGKYMTQVAAIENRGVPINIERLGKLCQNWEGIRCRVLQEHDPAGKIYTRGRFDETKFERLTVTRDWPRLKCGRLNLDDDTFKEMAHLYPEIATIREIRRTVNQLNPAALTIGTDGRNRCSLEPFSSITGRNQPSSTRFVYGQPCWLRNLITPSPGYGIAHLDYSQQEFGIAAGLSGDEAMIRDYLSGDPYLAFAVQAGAAPTSATRHSHPSEREQFKQCAIAMLYGMGATSLARRINRSVEAARLLIDIQRRTYPIYWQWSDSVFDDAMLSLKLRANYGWQIHFPEQLKEPSVRNWPMQSNGAEMLRLAIIYAGAARVRICAPIHDALLIEAPLDELDGQVKLMKHFMGKASVDVLQRLELRTDVAITRYPDHYRPEKGQDMWDRVWRIVQEIETEQPGRLCDTACGNGAHPSNLLS